MAHESYNCMCTGAQSIGGDFNGGAYMKVERYLFTTHLLMHGLHAREGQCACMGL